MRSIKKTPYQARDDELKNCSEATPVQLNALSAYPQPTMFYTDELVELFLQKYQADIELYTQTLGYDRDGLLKAYV